MKFYDIETAGVIADDLLQKATRFVSNISAKSRSAQKEQRSGIRKSFKAYADACADIMTEIDDMRDEIWTEATNSNGLDLDCAIDLLDDMLCAVYPAHRVAVNPYSDLVTRKAYDVLRAVEEATEAARGAYNDYLLQITQEERATAYVDAI